jgi:CubicO group peptidase (beta-lactamase class C family)
MHIRLPFASALMLLVCAGFATAASPQEPAPTPNDPAPIDPAQLATQIGTYLQVHHTQRQFDGTALVADNGKVVYEGAFGLANADWDIQNDLDTRFRLGSITKQFTAMLVLLLVQEGKLELDAPIVRYLPGFPAESGKQVTIHHLLSHTSGIPRVTERPQWREELRQHFSVEQFVASFCTGPLEFVPGTGFRHNNTAYYLLGAIVEAVTGQTYATALRARILDPLQMNDTGCETEGEVLEKRATGYELLLGKRRVAPQTDMGNHFSSDGMYSTVRDLWKWDQALRSQRLLTGMLAQRMFTRSENDYGYGWHIDDRGIWNGSFNVAPSDGAIPGFRTLIGRIPARGRCIILLSNSGYWAVSDAALGIAAILEGRVLEGQALEDTAPEGSSQPPAWTLARTILDEGVEVGLAALAKLPQSIRETPRLPAGEVESTIDLLGFRLLKQDRVEEAVRLFEFNTRAFPKSSKRWDSLGEAHLQAGNRKLAIVNFRIASELEPWNATAKAKVEGFEKIESR